MLKIHYKSKTKIFGHELDLSPERLKLLEKLKELFDDEEMILGVIVDTKHPDDALTMIEYLESDEDKSYEQVILQSLYLNLHRQGKM